MPKIFLLDVTNRDGVQTAHLGLAKIEKLLSTCILMRWVLPKVNLVSQPPIMKPII